MGIRTKTELLEGNTMSMNQIEAMIVKVRARQAQTWLKERYDVKGMGFSLTDDEKNRAIISYQLMQDSVHRAN